MVTIYCIHCGAELESDLDSCPQCGAMKNNQFCENCGNKLRGDAAFCSKCGKSVNGTQSVSEPTNPIREIYKNSNIPTKVQTDPPAQRVVALIGLIIIGIAALCPWAEIWGYGFNLLDIHDIFSRVADSDVGFMSNLYLLAFVISFIMVVVSLFRDDFSKRKSLAAHRIHSYP